MIDPRLSDRFISARRDAIALDFSHLNDMQLKAVMATEGPLLLLAGAGSGKTTVLINRIANLMKYGRGSDTAEIPDFVTEDDLLFLEEYAKNPAPDGAERARRLCAVEPAEPWRIIAITFTNKAADELKARLEKMIGPASSDIWAMTFHSACVRMLRRDIDRLGYSSSFTIYDTSDSLSLLKRVLKDLNLDDRTYPPRTLLTYISRAKDEMITPEEYLSSAMKSGDIRRRNIAHAYLEYTNRLKAANALDFDDLILLAVRLLEENDDLREYYQRKFKYVLVDEYQDTNRLQYRLVSLLSGGYGNICVVGDDDQSIYRFRGATIENILNFENEYRNARVIRLEQNYRSTGHILNAANDVIRNNRGRKGKNLWTDRGPGEKLKLYVAESERDEAQFVALQIVRSVETGARWSDHAVLYRMNAQSNQLEHAFRQLDIPYRVIGGTRFFDRAEVKDVLSYLGVIANPADDVRLLRIINSPPRGIGQATIDRLQEIASAEGVPLFTVLKSSVSRDELKKASPKLMQFAQMVEELREMSAVLPLDIFYDALLDKTGYIRALEAHKTDESVSRVENVRELKSNIVGFLRENPGGTLADFLSEVALYTDVDQLDRGLDCVVMMTMHSAKGLEFPTVFIVGAEEGIFPGIRSIGEPEEMEEERRLCYVAMTRARERLFITCARQRMLFGRTVAGKPSRFIEEVSDENIEKYDCLSGFPDRSARLGESPAGRGGGGPGRAAGTKREIFPSPPPSPAPSYRKGDVVVHKVFGRGLVTDVKPSGGDALLEIAFDAVGTKRLLAKSASAHMSKEDTAG